MNLAPRYDYLQSIQYRWIHGRSTAELEPGADHYPNLSRLQQGAGVVVDGDID